VLSSVDGGIQIGTIVVVAPGDEPAVQRVNEEEVSHSAGLLWRASPVNNAMPIHLRGADLNGADLSGARVGMTLFADTNLRGKPTRRTGPSAAVADLPHQHILLPALLTSQNLYTLVLCISLTKYLASAPNRSCRTSNALRHFAELERQYCHFSTAGYMGARSPDHADAAIWALTELMIDREPQPNIRFPDISRHTWRPTSSY